MNFRKDINGLRAIAVLGVILFHFKVFGITGGYVGVDVFFVISGFLMTGIIYNKITNDNFSLSDFYIARVKRILPALGALVVVALIFGYFFTTPLDYRALGRESYKALSFISNIFYSQRGDYFEPRPENKWMLHTWSLSVEWQFYMLFPLLFMALKKLKKLNNVKNYIYGLFFVSLIASIIHTIIRPDSAFFMLHTRIWEFMGGGIIFLLADKIPASKWIKPLGLAMIAVAMFFYTDGAAYPGYLAILPVAGAMLVIAAKDESAFLNNKIMQVAGNTSYSLYLWHWFVLQAAEYFDTPMSIQNRVSLITLSIALGVTSYYLVENPLRYKTKSLSKKQFIFAAAVLFAALYIPSKYVFKQDGLPKRLTGGAYEAAMAAKNYSKRSSECTKSFEGEGKQESCKIGDQSQPSTLVLWGDSHAKALFDTMDRLLKENHRAGEFFSSAGCPAIIDVGFNSKRYPFACKKNNYKVLDYIRKHKDVIQDTFIVSRWTTYLVGPNYALSSDKKAPYVFFDMPEYKNLTLDEAYKENIVKTLCSASKLGIRTHAMVTVPEVKTHPANDLAISRLLHNRDIEVTLPIEKYKKRNETIISAMKKAHNTCGVHVIDPTVKLCPNGACKFIVNNYPIYYDGNHLNDAGAKTISPLLETIFKK